MTELKNGTVLKSDVLALINCHIRAYVVDNTKHEAVLALYKLSDAIDDMPVREANWLRDTDGAWKCSHCGNRFFNGTGRWHNYCDECGYTMV